MYVSSSLVQMEDWYELAGMDDDTNANRRGYTVHKLSSGTDSRSTVYDDIFYVKPALQTMTFFHLAPP